MDDPFTEDYFLRGAEKGLSLYSSYRWLGQPTIDMAKSMIDHLGITQFHSILDYGCARGYLVRGLRAHHIKAHGVDISRWAIENADPLVAHLVSLGKPEGEWDWVISKDTLEHVHDLHTTIDNLMAIARIGLFVVVPLSASDGAPYVVEDYEKDITHIHRLTLGTWIGKFMRPGWKVEAQYLVPGIKCNYSQFPTGNGFITMRRL